MTSCRSASSPSISTTPFSAIFWRSSLVQKREAGYSCNVELSQPRARPRIPRDFHTRRPLPIEKCRVLAVARDVFESGTTVYRNRAATDSGAWLPDARASSYAMDAFPPESALRMRSFAKRRALGVNAAELGPH